MLASVSAIVLQIYEYMHAAPTDARTTQDGCELPTA
eukprot:SAG31_NODE_950_length_10811_cov_4.497760_3_plen_36_part_00